MSPQRSAPAGLGHSAQAGPDPTAAPVLELRGVRKRYGTVEVLAGVDLSVDQDELVALVGENGVGKTTIVRCIAEGLPVDHGVVRLLGRPVQAGVVPAADAVDVVWQDLALCPNLDVIDNLFLGRESSWRLPTAAERNQQARGLLRELDIDLPDLTRPVSTLSGGQRQSVALARTLIRRSRLLILDEPTAAMDSAGARAVSTLIRRMRAQGTAILLVSHDLDLVCQIADRALVLRDGVIVADVRRPEMSVDVLRAHVSGLLDDALARRQIHALRSLVDQLAAVEPSAVLPMVVSAVSVALAQPRIGLHLLLPDGDGAQQLKLAATLGVDAALRPAIATVSVGGRGPQALAVDGRAPVTAADLRTHPDPSTSALVPLGVRSMWTVPLVGGNEVLGTLSGYGDAHGVVSEGALELATLYASHAAAALDHDRLLAAVTRRNQTLETLRQVLETLAGPEADDDGLAIAMEALRLGLGAESLVLLDSGPAGLEEPADHLVRLSTDGDPTWARSLRLPEVGEVASLLDGRGRAVLATTVQERDHGRSLLARWSTGESPRAGSMDLLVDGAHSVLLALERRAHEATLRETATLRRSRDLQRTFLARLSHELRTPLTAIHGYADTLRQPDVTWDDTTTRRFLDTIARESDRLGQLVSALLDASAIEAGVLHLQMDWCELSLVVESAVACVPVPLASRVVVGPLADLPPIRADHDRLEQALVNLIGNAVAHTPSGTTTTVRVEAAPADRITLVVADDGPGLPPAVADALFVPGVRGGSGVVGAGLGLAITHGIVRAHGGTIEVRTGPDGTSFSLLLPVDGPTADVPGWTFTSEPIMSMSGRAGPRGADADTVLAFPDLHEADT